MLWLCTLAVATAAWPLGRTWWANRQTTLLQAVLWAAGAWVAWLLVFLGAAAHYDADVALGRHMALALTGCAGVAVLGARRPGVGPWNFVVCGLLAVLLLPIAEGWGRPRLDLPPLLFLGATLVVGLLNYLPTRLGLAALLLAGGCGLEFALLAAPRLPEQGGGWMEPAAGLCLALAPWAGLLLLGRSSAAGGEDFDALWLDFRNRFGAVWGLRVREQFNRSAANAGWPVTLQWHGLAVNEGATPPPRQELLEKLRALLKRFGPEEVGA
jgi:hypothetical protein